MSPLALQGIEASLLMMSQEPTSISGEENFIEQISDMLAKMQDWIRNQHASSQANLDQVWGDLKKCHLDAQPSNFKNSQQWHESHMICRNEESQRYITWMECVEKKEILCAMVPETWTEHIPYHESWPQNCLYPVDQLKTDQTNFPWLVAKRDQFQTAYDDWHLTYMKWFNASKDCEDTKVECSVKWTNYLAKRTECDKIQLNMEQFACGDGNPGCDSYKECYDCNFKQWTKTEASVKTAEDAWKAEWEGILRIQCYVDSFGSCQNDVNRPTCLTTKMGQCKTSVIGQAQKDEVTITYHPVAPETVPAKLNCDFSYFGETPGSLVFMKKHFGEMPDYVTYNICGAKCCVKEAGCCYGIQNTYKGPCCLNSIVSTESNCPKSSTQDFAFKCPITADNAAIFLGR